MEIGRVRTSSTNYLLGLRARGLGIDEATVKKRIEENDAITKISAGENNFCGSKWVKFPSVPS